VTDSTRSDDQPLTMTTNWPRPTVCLVQLAGELDNATAPLLANYLREQTASAPTHLLLDLAAVRFLAAAGVTLIMDALRHYHGIHGELHLTGITDDSTVDRVLDLTGVRAILSHHRSVEDALHHIDSSG